MDSIYWQRRWERGQIGWHQDSINRHLTEHWPQLRLETGATIFVPLCGKALDLLWLAAQGHRVLGVEISALAVNAFLDENRLHAERAQDGLFQRVVAGEIELLIGDFFTLEQRHLEDVVAVYDRASLIALPPAQRPRYAAKLASLLTAGTQSLLITLDYDQWQMNGPPFSVGDAEVHDLFEPSFSLEHLANHDVLAEEPRWRQRGLDALTERVYLLTRR
jgi:thiopurine S-methyltransferase